MIEDAVEELICIFLHKAQEQLALESGQCTDRTLKGTLTEFLKFIGPRGQNIMRSANNVGNAGPHVRQTFLNDVYKSGTLCLFILLIFWGLFTQNDRLTHHNIFKYIYFHDSYQ
jgi:hypothetical protein